jgi:hypothetical protein
MPSWKLLPGQGHTHRLLAHGPGWEHICSVLPSGMLRSNRLHARILLPKRHSQHSVQRRVLVHDRADSPSPMSRWPVLPPGNCKLVRIRVLLPRRVHVHRCQGHLSSRHVLWHSYKHSPNQLHTGTVLPARHSRAICMLRRLLLSQHICKAEVPVGIILRRSIPNYPNTMPCILLLSKCHHDD